MFIKVCIVIIVIGSALTVVDKISDMIASVMNKDNITK